MLSFRVASATGVHKLSVENIIQEVRDEISRLQQVLALLGAETGHTATAAKKNAAPTSAAPRRKLSAAGRRRIAAAQKARWAKIRAAKK